MALADIRVGLRTYLLSVTAISNAVGGNRIYPGILPQGEKQPSIVYNRITGQGDNTMDGPSGLSRPRFQIDAWAASADEAAELANLVKEHIDGYRGLMGDVVVQGVFFDSERDDYQADIKMFRVSRDYLIWYEER